ncbi:cyclic lactone autoinducer peptide [Clostridium estertheticum]|nr:cyclic lactone autoinducer peptide [Clostridium estertheticum]MBU3214562.1 cyclic lactone autoinducer peptide [Clostridium estertheticum]WAG56545.1 cyclic lactone autoinducer peptide [Clostridium estertheticum]
MKFLKKHLFTLIAVATTLAATSVASSACYWASYQPEEPKCLREK